MELTKEQKLFQTLVQKAWEDIDFKKELLANPVDAIENLTGKRVKVPEGKSLVVRDQTDKSVIYINIPAEPNMDDVELTEEQLEIVAGGGNPTPPVIDDPLSGMI
jgi:hypothetical protein